MLAIASSSIDKAHKPIGFRYKTKKIGSAATAKGAIKKYGTREPTRKNSPPVTRSRLSTSSYPPEDNANAGRKDSAKMKRRELFQFARGRLEKAQNSGSVVRVKKCKLSSN